MRRKLAPLALLTSLALVVPAGASQPGSSIATKSRESLVRANALKVRVKAPAGTRVTLAPKSALAAKRTLTFKRDGTRVAKLKLSGVGRLAAKSCAPLQLKVDVRSVSGGRRSVRTLSKLFPPAKACPGSPRIGTPTGGAGGSGTAPDAQGGSGGGTPAQPSSVKAGAARADITAPVGTPMFAYTARNKFFRAPGSPPDPSDPAADAEYLAGTPSRLLQIFGDPDHNLYAKGFEESKGIHTRVYARAIVIQSSDKKYAMVQADLGGLPYALTKEVESRIAQTGITGDRLMLSATHSHSSTGPIWPVDNMGYGVLGGDLFDPRIFELTADGIAQSIIDADSHLEPARVGVGTVEVRGASNNRASKAYEKDPEKTTTESIDPNLSVVRVDADNGRPIGVWSNFAIHPTSFGDENANFSGDNAASAERVAESAINADAQNRGVAPDPSKPVVDVWTNANEGDISPNGDAQSLDGEALQYVQTSEASSNMAGTKVGQGIYGAWREAGANMKGDIAIDARRTFLTFQGQENTALVPALGAGGIEADDGTCAPVDSMGGPGQGKKMPLFGAPGIVPQSHPISFWRIDRLGVAAYPAEITKTMGQRIRQRLVADSGGKIDRAIIAGLTNSYVSYTATPEEYDYCGYEGSFTLFGTNEGLAWMAGGRDLAGALFSGSDVPAGIEPPTPAFGTPNQGDPTTTTPEAGTTVNEPAAELKRFGRATYTWKGGDSSVDAPRGKPFVSLQREVSPGDWQTVGTEEGVNDVTTYDKSAHTWTDTWQFGASDALGRYRFKVTGMANKDGSAVTAYPATSHTFELGPTDPIQKSVDGGHAIARYPAPSGALTALPRVVRTGTARIKVSRAGGAMDTITAKPSADHPWYELPEGATPLSIESVDDGSGNS